MLVSVVSPLPGAELPVPAAVGRVSHGDTVSLPCTLVGQERGGERP